MTITYLTNTGFVYNSFNLKWYDDRKHLRSIFQNKHKDHDQIVDVAEFFNGDESKNIHIKRDIYENIHSDNDMLFLNYDENDRLKDIEIHSGYDIYVENIILIFGTEISDTLMEFAKKGIKYSKIDDGTFLLPDLKISIADNESMGGNGHGLGYFYGTSNIEHLIE